MDFLKDKVAMVTGASRGVGKGIALGLGEFGATVYVTGRTINDEDVTVPLPGTIHETAEEINKMGGRGIPIQCDHRNDEEVKALFERVFD